MKRNISILLVLAVLSQALCIGVFAAGDAKKPVYKNFVIYGDSICLGFSTEAASMADASTYDIEENLLRAAQGADYRHCYPTQFAHRVGIDTFSDLSYADGDRFDYLAETEWNDVYNFGICAAWSSDIRELLTNPYYVYEYASANYGKGDTYVLPDDYTGIRYVVDTAAEGYDPANPATWIYLTGEEYIDHYEGMFDWWTYQWVNVPVYKTEEYSLPAGTEITVAYDIEMYGIPYLTLNSIITEKYFYVSEHCLDGYGKFIDTNSDGEIDNTDIIFYPVTAYLNPMLGLQYIPNTEEYGAALGKALPNPQFTKYYFDLSTTAARQGDLIALAMGNNDIYHSFMPYQQSSDSILCTLVYWLTYALQMNYTVGDIIQMLEDPTWQSMLFGGNIPFSAEGSEADAAEADPAPAEPPAGEDGQAPSGSLLAGLINADEINALLNLYSSENVTAYLKDTVEAYKENYEATILRTLELKQEKAELVLIGHYNPFGMINYLTMLSLAAQNGQLLEHLGGDLSIIGTLLQAIIGTPEQWENINQMDENELIEYTESANSEMASFLASLKNLDLSDPNVNQALTGLIVDLSFPISVLLVGEALADTYAEMNDFLVEMAEKYDLAYVDVSDAPCSGRYDPHPTEYGHAWIADRLYETVVPEITASVSPASTGKGVLNPQGNKEFRLRDSQTYRFLADEGSDISAIFIDGQMLDKDEYSAVYADGKYTFEKIMAKHSITLQFDDDPTGARKYAVNVLGSYAKYGAGEGMYKAGDTVHISAGALEGFEFTGWQVDGVELDDNMSIVAAFEMPENDVTAIATWKVVEEEPESTPSTPTVGQTTRWYELSFETNGGTAIPAYSKKSGTAVELDAFLSIRSGYKFGGWYLDKALTEPVSKVTLDKNITVYAKWTDETQTNADPKLPFIDVKQDDWFHNNVAYVYGKGIMKGTGSVTFGPGIDMTRAMVVTILHRLEGEPAVSGEAPFDDVRGTGDYYEKAVTWAAGNDIVNGYGNGKFGPNDHITREQMAAIMYRYASFKKFDVSARENLSKFTDAASVSEYALVPMSWANAIGLIAGMPDMTLQPGGNATRAQAAAILHRFCDWMAPADKA